MGKKVFANGMEIAHKAGVGKVIAAFPDVCNSPPSPPAGPIPVPYPNTSKASDLQQGSKTVKIGGKPIALETQSYYKTSPLGDEAATNGLGASLLTHTITGKTYFQAYSMDVEIEGKKACRHLDITTSNHASYPGSTPPMPNTEAQNLALDRIEQDLCPCCGGPKHADGTPMNRDEWYEDNLQKKHDQRIAQLDEQMTARQARVEALQGQNPKRVAAAVARVAETSNAYTQAYKNHNAEKGKLKNLMHRAKTRPGCTCKKPPPPILPSPPCDVFFERPPPGPQRDQQQAAIEDEWNKYRAKHVGHAKTPKALVGVRSGQQVNHLTPKSAGGCPTGDGNLQSHEALCPACKAIDGEFNAFQS